MGRWVLHANDFCCLWHSDLYVPLQPFGQTTLHAMLHISDSIGLSLQAAALAAGAEPKASSSATPAEAKKDK